MCGFPQPLAQPRQRDRAASAGHAQLCVCCASSRHAIDRRSRVAIQSSSTFGSSPYSAFEIKVPMPAGISVTWFTPPLRRIPQAGSGESERRRRDHAIGTGDSTQTDLSQVPTRFKVLEIAYAFTAIPGARSEALHCASRQQQNGRQLVGLRLQVVAQIVSDRRSQRAGQW